MNAIEERLERIEKLVLLGSKSVFNTEEAALYVGKTQETINRWCRQGKLRHYMKNEQRWIKRVDLDDFLTSDVIEDNNYYERKAEAYVRKNKLQL